MPFVKTSHSQATQKATAYLELLNGETAAGPGTAVVLDGRASDDGTEEVDRTRGDGSSLGPTSVPTPDLATGLYFHNVRICWQSLETHVAPISRVEKKEKNIDFEQGSGFLENFIVPDRSGFEPGAASPFGDLYI